MSKTRTKEDAMRRVKSKAATISRFMNSPLGSKVMRLLEEEFPEGVGRNPHDTYFKLGTREVIGYLRQLQRIGDKEDQHETV